MRPALTSAGVWALLAGCGGAPAQTPRPAPTGYHGVVVWLNRTGTEVQSVSFTPRWERRDSTDSALAFSRVRLPDGWGAAGELRGDSLTWSLSRLTGDVGVGVELAGTADAEGRVTGCALPRRRGSFPAPVAAFAIAPLDRPAPVAADAPLDRCRGAADSSTPEAPRPQP